MVNRKLTCIGCPRGCQISVQYDEQGIYEISGNICKIGDTYARNEITDPKRIVTTTLKVINGKFGEKMVSCKTSKEVPKGKIMDVIVEIKNITVKAPVCIGDILVPNVAGTDANIVVTADVE